MGCTPTLHVFTHVPQCSYNQKQRPFYQKELFIYINIYLGLCKIQKDQIPLNTKTKPQKTNSPVCSTKTGFRGPGKNGPMEECWPGPGRWQSAQQWLPASLVPLNEVLLVGAAGSSAGVCARLRGRQVPQCGVRGRGVGCKERELRRGQIASATVTDPGDPEEGASPAASGPSGLEQGAGPRGAGG